MISKILRALPELESRRSECEKFCGGGVSEWKTLDIDTDTVLLGCEVYDGNSRVNGNSGIAVVSGCLSGEYKLHYLEFYGEQIKLARLHSAAGIVAAVRFEEYDDRADLRYGWDDVCLINYRSGQKESVERFRFEGGAYHAGNIKIDMNRTTNRLAMARDERQGWDDSGRIVAGIYDLAAVCLIARADPAGVRSLNAVELPGNGDLLIITDNNRNPHSFKVTGDTLVEVLDQKLSKG